MSSGGNPQNPARASFPVPPPVANMPVVDPKSGMFTPVGLNLIQQIWAAIAGTGGSSEVIAFLVALAQTPPFEYSSAENAALPYRLAALQTPQDPVNRNGYVPFFPSDPVKAVIARLRVGYSYQVPIDGFSITVPDGTTNLILAPAGALATGTVTMPANPLDSQICGVASSQAVAALTMSPNTGQTLNGALTAFTANSFAQYQYVQSVATWFRIG